MAGGIQDAKPCRVRTLSGLDVGLLRGISSHASSFKHRDEKRQRHFVNPPPLSWPDAILRFPQRVLGWAMINTFGLKMIYPGSVHTLQYFLAPGLTENRANLAVNYKGERFKLETVESNQIDAMFFNRQG